MKTCGVCGSSNITDLGHGVTVATVICHNCGAHWWQRWFTRADWEKWINENTAQHTGKA